MELHLISSQTHRGNIHLNKNKENEIDFLMNLLQPFIDAYLVSYNFINAIIYSDKNVTAFTILLNTKRLQIILKVLNVKAKQNNC